MLKFNAALRRRWPLLVALLVLGIITGGISGMLSESPKAETGYRATQVVIARKGPNTVVVSQDTLKVLRGRVLKLAAKRLDGANLSRVTRGVSATSDKEASAISIACERPSATAARSCTQAFVDSFLEVANEDAQQDDQRLIESLKEQRNQTVMARAALRAENPGIDTSIDPGSLEIQQQLSRFESQLADLDTQIRRKDLDLSKAVGPYEALGVEPAKPAAGSVLAIPASAPLRAALLGGFGLLFGAVIILVLERAYPRIDSRDDVLDVTTLPILAEIGWLPRSKQPYDDQGVIQLDGPWAEPYRRLRAAVRFVQTAQDHESAVATLDEELNDFGGRPEHATAEQEPPGRVVALDSLSVDGASKPRTVPKTFLIASTTPGEGKSITSALLSVALAEQEPTLVIGGDFRRPGLDKLLGNPEGPTLHDRAQLSEDRPALGGLLLATPYRRLHLVSSGPGSREVVGRISATRDLIRAAKATATIVVDTSPLQASSDTLDLLGDVDYTLLTVRAGSLTQKQLAETIEILQRMGAPILGIVLIGATGRSREQRHYYDYYTET